MPARTEDAVRKGMVMMRLMLGYLPLPLMRWLTSLTDRKMVLPDNVHRESIHADGVPCEWLVPTQHDDAVLLYLHGGGFVLGWYQVHRYMVAYLAKQAGIKTLAVDYRLAPEHPFPAGLDDCVTAYRWLLKQGYAPEKIVIAGDSAGGNFALTTLLKLRDDGLPMPAAVACLSPAVDLTEKDESIPARYDALLHPRAIRLFFTSYLANQDPHNPLISPLLANLTGLPPLLIHGGDEELLRDDIVAFNDRARSAGVDVTFKLYPRMWHVWHLNIVDDIPEAKQALDEIAQFLSSHVHKKVMVGVE